MSPLPLAILAAEEFRRRQIKARAVVATRRMTKAQAEAHLRPWLAIACTLGADLPELADLLESREGNRWLTADDICPRERWAPVLIAARDLAGDKLQMDGTDVFGTAALICIAGFLAYDVNGSHPIPAYDASKARQRSQARRAAAPESLAA